MLAAYYGKGCDSRALFQGLNIAKDKSIKKIKLNKHMEKQGAFTSASYDEKKQIEAF